MKQAIKWQFIIGFCDAFTERYGSKQTTTTQYRLYYVR